MDGVSGVIDRDEQTWAMRCDEKIRRGKQQVDYCLLLLMSVSFVLSQTQDPCRIIYYFMTYLDFLYFTIMSGVR